MIHESIYDFLNQRLQSYINVVGTFLTIIAVFLSPIVVWRHRNTTAKISTGRLPSLPCLPSLPLVGSTIFIFRISDLFDPGFVLMRALADFCTKRSKRLGSTFAFYKLSRYAVVLNGRRTIAEAFVRKGVHFADRDELILEQEFTNRNSNGIITAGYDETFSKRRHQIMSYIVQQVSSEKQGFEERIHQHLQHFICSVDRNNGKPFNPLSDLFDCVVGVSLNSIFGCRFENSHPLLQQIRLFAPAINEAMFRLETLPALRFLPPYRKRLNRLVDMNSRLFQLTDTEIDRCLSANRTESLVFKYVQHKGNEHAHGEELHYVLRDLFFSGTDTSIITLRWLLLMMANYPNKQTKLQNEIDSLYGESDRFPSADDQSRLPYVEATILEVLRLEPPLPMSIPRRTLCDAELDGYFIPKGAVVLANLYGVHTDPDEWENPMEFNPERFISTDGKVFGRDRIIPFSVGKRACVGEQLARHQLFMLFTGIMRNFHVCPAEGQVCINVRRVNSAFIRPSDFEMRFVRRRN